MHRSKLFMFAIAVGLSVTCLPGIDTNTVMADTLVIQDTGQFYSKDKPQKGISMAQVRKRFGEPVKSYAAVGIPPITRWRYDGFTVYFEHNHVIHAVNNKR